MRKTEQRACILEALREGPPHSAADEVHRRVRHKLPGISLATVYRNLDLLSRQGLIRRLGGHGGRRRYDAVREAHGHFWCLACGEVEDIPFTFPQPEIDMTHPWMKGRVVYVASTDLQGLCPSCAEKAAAEQKD